MGCYIAPSDNSTIEDVAAAISARTYGAELLVDGDLNANLAEPEGTPQDEAIADELAAVGIVDMQLHFLPRHNPWLQDMCTGLMRRDEREVRSWTDNILRTDRRLFQDVDVQDPRHNRNITWSWDVLGESR